MDISTAATASIKTPEAETEAPTRIQPTKPLSSFTNGVLKRHHHLNPPPGTADVTYKECLKNHAATMGGHAVDGCGEFMASPSADPTNPTSLKCAACGCHRNFHRRDPEELSPPSAQHAIKYQPHHRHQPPHGHTSPNSASPPPISSSYMLLALSGGGLSVPAPENNPSITTHGITSSYPNGRKRFRTKFSQNQKERMLQFAERVGWKMQRKDEELISCFCGEIGVEKGVFKVWMHNNKSTLTLGKGNGNMENDSNGNRNSTFQNTHTNYHYQDRNGSASAPVVAGNGSSSSC